MIKKIIEFLRPNWKKIVVLGVIASISLTIGIQKANIAIALTPRYTTYFVPISWLPAVIINGETYVMNADTSQSIYDFVFNTPYHLGIILTSIYWYLLSCIIASSIKFLKPSFKKVILALVFSYVSLLLFVFLKFDPFSEGLISPLEPSFYLMIFLSINRLFIGLLGMVGNLDVSYYPKVVLFLIIGPLFFSSSYLLTCILFGVYDSLKKFKMEKNKLIVMVSFFILLSIPVQGEKEDMYVANGISYLKNKFLGENIDIVVTDSYNNFETNATYTVIKAFHEGMPVRIAINHLTNKSGDIELIDNEYNEYLDSLPKPYGKMDRDLRMQIKEEYKGYPKYEDLEPDTVSETFPVIFTAKNTRDLVKIAKVVNSLSGFPRVWNGKYSKHISADLPLSMVLKISNISAVDSIWLNFEVKVNIDQSVPAVGGRNLQENLSLNGKGVRVSVVDTGITLSHLCFHNTLVGGSSNLIDSSADVDDTEGHGSHVAGIIFCNASSYIGMAPDAELFNAKVMDSATAGNFDIIIQGIGWSVEKGVDVISLSIGDTYSDLWGLLTNPTDGNSKFTKFIDEQIYRHNVSIIVVAGNKLPCNLPNPGCNSNGRIERPGDSYNAITVGATNDSSDNFDVVAPFSGHGLTDDGRTKVDVVAPGTRIYSADGDTNNSMMLKSGTSMAAPHVSGLAALLYQYLRDNNRTIHPLLVKAVIINSATKIGNISGGEWSHSSQKPLDTNQGAGRIDALETYKTLNDSGRVYLGKVSTNNPAYYYINITNAPTNLTVTLTWNRHVTDASQTPPDLNDLDLYLFNSSETQINESNSWDDNVEHIHHQITSNGLYKIEVYPFDVDGDETYAIASSHKMTVKQNISLVNGQNLISIPKKLDEWNATKVLSSIYGKYEIVWAYNASDIADPWKKHVPDVPGWANDLKFMNPVFGYWIKANVSSTNLEIEGTPFNPINITLAEGWNLIGYPYTESQEISSALSSIDGKYAYVWEYDASDTSDPWKLYNPITSEDEIHYMEPGVGYWIKTTEATTLYLYGR